MHQRERTSRQHAETQRAGGADEERREEKRREEKRREEKRREERRREERRREERKREEKGREEEAAISRTMMKRRLVGRRRVVVSSDESGEASSDAVELGREIVRREAIDESESERDKTFFIKEEPAMDADFNVDDHMDEEDRGENVDEDQRGEDDEEGEEPEMKTINFRTPWVQMELNPQAQGPNGIAPFEQDQDDTSEGCVSNYYTDSED